MNEMKLSLSIAFIAAALVVACNAPDSPPDKPNIILIVTDDQSYGNLDFELYDIVNDAG